jgi:hypothetical protein
MPTSFPAASDSFVRPGTAEVQGLSVPTHSVHHDNVYDAIEAIEAKLGIGASAAAANQVLRATAAGVTSFGQVQTGDIATDAITSALIAAGTIAYGDVASGVLPTFYSTLLPGESTTSSSVVAMTGSSLPAITFTGRTALFGLSLAGFGNTSSAVSGVTLRESGANQGTFLNDGNSAGINVTKAAFVRLTPTAASHTYNLYWSTNTGTLSYNSGYLWVIVF